MNLFDSIKRIPWLRPNYDLAKERAKLEELRAKEEQVRRGLYFQMAESAKLRLEEILGHGLSLDVEQLSKPEDLGSLPDPAKSTSYRPFNEMILANATLHNPEDPASIIELQHIRVSDLSVQNQDQIRIYFRSNITDSSNRIPAYYTFTKDGELLASSTPNDDSRSLRGLSVLLNHLQTWEAII